MMFGLLLLPMLGAIGLAVDFGTILTARNLAQVGADGAVLQATGVARELIEKGQGTEAETLAAIAEAKQRATSFFEAYATENNLESHTFALNIARDGQKITASADFTVKADTYLAKVYGQDTYEAAGGATSGSSLQSYIDIYMAMDNSQSMGIAATPDEMKKLYKLRSCVFGCHVPEPWQTTSNETAANANGIRMRINVVRDAAIKMITRAENDASSAAYRFGLFTMGANPASPKQPLTTEISPISSDYPGLKTKASAIKLGYNNHEGLGDTHLNEQIAEIRNKIPTPGDGSSQTKAKSFLFIVTDGVRDVWGASGCTWNHCMGTISPAVCKQVKDKNIIVGVLYTTYLPIYADPFNEAKGFDDRYKQLVVNKGIVPFIGPKLEECASPGWYFEASDATGIDRALAKMFEQTTAAPSLTN